MSGFHGGPSLTHRQPKGSDYHRVPRLFGWGMSFLFVAMLMVLAPITFWLIRPRELEATKARNAEGQRVQERNAERPQRGGRQWRADPMVIAVNALGYYADHGLGHELLLPRRSGEADRCRDRMGDDHGLPRLQRRAPRHGLHLDVGWPAHRSDWRPRGDVDRHDHRIGRAPRALAGARPGELFGGLGRDRHRHALLSL